MTRKKIIFSSVALTIIIFAIQVLLIKSIAGVEQKKTVILARTRISAGTVIGAGMLKESEMPVGAVHRLSFGKAGDIIGKRAKTDIEDGEMILSTRIGLLGDLGDIRVLSPGNRLFCLDLKADQASGWRLAAGQLADILFVPERGAGLTESVEQDIFKSYKKLSSVRIAAIIDERLKVVGSRDDAGLPKYLLVEVTPEEAEFLACAKGAGRLEIAAVPY